MKTVFENSRKLTTFKSSAALVIGMVLAYNPSLHATALTAAQNAEIQHEKEHAAVLNLVPTNTLAKQVVHSGLWSNPATWNNNQLPKTNENIYVPEDKALTVDTQSAVKLGKVRVDGAIKFATNKNVGIIVDTLVVTSTGTFEIGSEGQRVPAANKVEIMIANNGPINRKLDPGNLSRGIILQGKTRIFGTDKSSFHELATKPPAGSTQLTLANAPTGWAKGDLIVVTATKFRYKVKGEPHHVTYDEVRRIQAISGSIITLGAVENAATSAPLKYNHVPTIAKMPVYVANLSRNVVFSGEGETSVPASQRGHFMVMHTPDVIIKGAGFYYLGRTDKSKPIDDFKLGSNGYRLKDAGGSFIPGANNNPRGRYSLHFHHTGVTDANTTPVICSGNAVISSPGWGFVNHTSHVLIENNASYDVYGSHYVSEDGNELGAFKHNIAIKSEGRPSFFKSGQGNHDVGHTGHGFWLESRNLVMENNVVSGVNKSGVMYWHRNEIPGVSLMVPTANLLSPDKELTKNMSSIWYEYIPITHEKNTTVLSSGGGLVVVKAFYKQDHDVRSMIDSFKAYSVLDGLELQYTEKYTLKDVELVADPVTASWNKGVTLMPKVRDVVTLNLKLKGFKHPVVTGTAFGGHIDETEINFVNSEVDGRAVAPGDIQKASNAVQKNYNPKFQHFHSIPLTSFRTSGTKLSFAPNKSMSANFPAGVNLGFIVNGTKTDSLGATPWDSRWFYKQLGETVKKGYYTSSSGDKYLVLTDVMSDRVTGETRDISTKLKIISYFKGLGPNLGKLP